MNRLSQARLSDVSLSGFRLLCTRHGCVNWWDEVGLPVGGRVCLTFRTWSPSLSLLFSLPPPDGHCTEWIESGMRKDNTFHHELEGGWVLLGGWASLSGVTYSSHSPRKMRLTLRGWSVAGRLQGKTLFISSRRLSFRFVVVVVRPIMKTAKRKFMFRCFFAACVRQAKRPPPSISSIFPSRRRREETIPAQFHFKSGRV